MYSNFGFPGGALVNNNQPLEPEEDAEPLEGRRANYKDPDEDAEPLGGRRANYKGPGEDAEPLEPPTHPDAQGQGLGEQGDAELRLGRRAQNSDLGSPSSPLLTPDSCIDSLVSSDVTNLQLQFRQWRPEPHAW